MAPENPRETPRPYPPPQVPAPVPPSPKEAVPDARMTVNQTVIYQPPSGPAFEVCSHNAGSYTRLLWTVEQPYVRDVVVRADWQPLDLGWLRNGPPPSLIVLVNREGVFRGGQPTEEQRKAVLARVVEVGIKVKINGSVLDRYPDEEMHDMGVFEFARVRPYESSRFEPYVETEYFIRCPNGPAKMTIVAVPGDGK